MKVVWSEKQVKISNIVLPNLTWKMSLVSCSSLIKMEMYVLHCSFFYFVHPKFLPIKIQFEYRDDDRGWKGVVWEGWDETWKIFVLRRVKTNCLCSSISHLPASYTSPPFQVWYRIIQYSMVQYCIVWSIIWHHFLVVHIFLQYCHIIV